MVCNECLNKRMEQQFVATNNRINELVVVVNALNDRVQECMDAINEQELEKDIEEKG